MNNVIILYLSQSLHSRNSPFTENNGNFLILLEIIYKLYSMMDEDVRWILKIKKNSKYVNDIYNKMRKINLLRNKNLILISTTLYRKSCWKITYYINVWTTRKNWIESV